MARGRWTTHDTVQLLCPLLKFLNQDLYLFLRAEVLVLLYSRDNFFLFRADGGGVNLLVMLWERQSFLNLWNYGRVCLLCTIMLALSLFLIIKYVCVCGCRSCRYDREVLQSLKRFCMFLERLFDYDHRRYQSLHYILLRWLWLLDRLLCKR